MLHIQFAVIVLGEALDDKNHNQAKQNYIRKILFKLQKNLMINHKFVSYTFFPFFTFFPSPNLNFGVLSEKWECTNFLESKLCFLLLSYSFFHFFIPKTKFRCNWEKMGLDPLTNTCFPLFSYTFYRLPDSYPKRTLVRICVLKISDFCPKWSLVRILDQNI